MPPKPKKIDTSSEAARRIRELRESRGETQTSFARALGTEPSAVSKWEAGRNQPQPKVFAKLATLAIGEARRFFQVLAGLDESSAVFDGSGILPRTRVDGAPESISPRSHHESTTGPDKAHETYSWDPELLAWVVETIEAGLKGRARPDPDKYASAVIACYEVSHRAGTRDAAMVISILKVA
jgi:transcriptional regulator with XRE-family HTH domain